MKYPNALETQTVLIHTENDRVLNVSILVNGCFIFEWSNGDEVEPRIIRKYCRQINNAKTTLEGRIRDRQQAHGLNLYRFADAESTRKGIYTFPTTRKNSSDVQYTYPGRMVPQKHCTVDHLSNLIKPIHVL